MKKNLIGLFGIFAFIFAFSMIFSPNASALEDTTKTIEKVVYEKDYFLRTYKIGETKVYDRTEQSYLGKTLVSSTKVADYPEYTVYKNVYQHTYRLRDVFKVTSTFEDREIHNVYRVTYYTDGTISRTLVSSDYRVLGTYTTIRYEYGSYTYKYSYETVYEKRYKY